MFSDAWSHYVWHFDSAGSCTEDSFGLMQTKQILFFTANVIFSSWVFYRKLTQWAKLEYLIPNFKIQFCLGGDIMSVVMGSNVRMLNYFGNIYQWIMILVLLLTTAALIDTWGWWNVFSQLFIICWLNCLVSIYTFHNFNNKKLFESSLNQIIFTMIS